MKDALPDLVFLNRLLNYFFGYVVAESDIGLGNFEFALSDALKDTSSESYERLFKSWVSIINKLWRKNNGKKQKECVTLSNIKTEISDLIRTEIIGETLYSCQFLALRLERKCIHDPALLKDYDEIVKKIAVEPEMKMSSGYFAYHVMFYFKSGNILEVQIYSSMMKKWRDLSHHLYEIVRLNPTNKPEFGTTESRMISLGHLLHLAECEIDRLQKELPNLGPR